MADTTQTIPVVALAVAAASFVVSLVSVTVSAMAFGRDRAKVKARGTIFTDDPNNFRLLELRVVNAGRRPCYLAALVSARFGHQSRSPLPPTEPTVPIEVTVDEILDRQVPDRLIKLGEGEVYRITISARAPAELYLHSINEFASTIWFEDALGRKIRVPHCKRLLEQLLPEKDRTVMKRVR